MNPITSTSGVSSPTDLEQSLEDTRRELELARVTLSDYQSGVSSSSANEPALRSRVESLETQVADLEAIRSDLMQRAEQAALAVFQSEERAAHPEQSRDAPKPSLWKQCPNEVVDHELLRFWTLEDLVALSKVSVEGLAGQARQHLEEMTKELFELASQHPLIEQSIAVVRSEVTKKQLTVGKGLLAFQVDFAQRLKKADLALVISIYQQIHDEAGEPTTAPRRRTLASLQEALVARLARAELRKLPESLRADREIVLAAVQQNVRALQFAAPALRADRKIMLAQVQQNGLALEYASAVLRKDPEIVLAAVQQYGWALKDADPFLRGDREIVRAAVQQTGYALQFADPSLRVDREIVRLALQQNGNALEFADPSLRGDREIVRAAVQQTGHALQFADPSLRVDREIVRVALQQNGNALQFADPSLRMDREIVRVALQETGTALRYADPALRADPEIVRAAVQQTGTALQDADPALRADREIVRAAVQQNGYALRYAEPALRADREIVRAAAQQNGTALEFAHGTALQFTLRGWQTDRDSIEEPEPELPAPSRIGWFRGTVRWCRHALSELFGGLRRR